MTQQVTSAIVLTKTKGLVNIIAEATHEKKYAIYDRAIRDYAQKKQIEIPSES